MKRLMLTLSLAACTAMLFQYCASSKTKKAKEMPVTFEGQVLPLLNSKCGPCHTPGGKKKIYQAADVVKTDIDDIIKRVSMQPNERGFMPFKKTEKLPDSLVQVFVKWKEGGFVGK